MKLDLASHVLPPEALALAGPPSAEFSAPTARGGRKPTSPLFIDVIRPLVEDDIPLLVSPPKAEEGAVTLVKLRQSHHRLAQLLVSGENTQAEVALLTGYSESYISNIQNDPSFAGLMAHYASARELRFIDVIERMKSLGIDAMEELQERLAAAPEKFTKKELQEIMDQCLGPSVAKATAAASGGAAPAAQVVISFRASPLPVPVGPIIEGEIEAGS